MFIHCSLIQFRQQVATYRATLVKITTAITPAYTKKLTGRPRPGPVDFVHAVKRRSIKRTGLNLAVRHAADAHAHRQRNPGQQRKHEVSPVRAIHHLVAERLYSANQCSEPTE